MRKKLQWIKIFFGRMLLMIIIFYGVQWLIWPLIGDQLVAWIEAKISGAQIP